MVKKKKSSPDAKRGSIVNTDKFEYTYTITDEEGNSLDTHDRLITSKRVEQGFHVRELKEITNHTEDSVIVLRIYTQFNG